MISPLFERAALLVTIGGLSFGFLATCALFSCVYAIANVAAVRVIFAIIDSTQPRTE